MHACMHVYECIHVCMHKHACTARMRACMHEEKDGHVDGRPGRQLDAWTGGLDVWIELDEWIGLYRCDYLTSADRQQDEPGHLMCGFFPVSQMMVLKRFLSSHQSIKEL